jgi:hypothetical protein
MTRGPPSSLQQGQFRQHTNSLQILSSKGFFAETLDKFDPVIFILLRQVFQTKILLCKLTGFVGIESIFLTLLK